MSHPSSQPGSQPGSQPTFSLIFRGDLVPGFTAADVKANLARLFKAGPETVEKLFSGRPLAIKKGLDRAQAEQLQATLARMGAQASIRAEGEAAAPPRPAPRAEETPAPPPPAQPDWSLAPMEGNLLKAHEREKKEEITVSTDHLSLQPVGGQLLEESERPAAPPVSVRVPDWELE